ncbi:copper-sensitivity suppressor A protein [Aeromonas media WS]|nr:copper-sensitivity suppressor A protein [Aeromonas media WS]
MATRLLLLVCILVLNCAAQPLARLAQLDQALSCQMLPLSSSSADANEGQAATPQPSSCQLNGKWLSAANLLCAEQIFFAIAFVIALLAPLSRRAPALPPPINISPPERRLHLTLCVWRE